MNITTGTDQCYALAARKKARYLTRLYDSKLSTAGLTASQFSILALLGERGQLKLAEVGEALIMERTSLVRALKPLQSAGYIASLAPDSGRAFDISLSAAGRAKVAEALPLWRAAQVEFEEQVGAERAVRQRDEVLGLGLAV